MLVHSWSIVPTLRFNVQTEMDKRDKLTDPDRKTKQEKRRQNKKANNIMKDNNT